MNHRNLRSILDDVQSIAVVGASSNPKRDSYKVMKFLRDYGFDIFPVNPNLANTKILGQKCYENLEAIEEKIDMVDVFRAIEHIPSITHETIKIKDTLFTEANNIRIADELRQLLNDLVKNVFVNNTHWNNLFFDIIIEDPIYFNENLFFRQFNYSIYLQ